MRYKYLIILSIVAFAVVLCGASAGFASILNSADNFAVLAGSTVTNTGASTVNGDIGVWPGSAITGYPLITHTGTLYLGPGPGPAQTAQGDLTTAFNGLAGMPVNGTLTSLDLGTLTLAPGVYKYATSAQLTGTLKLDAQGNNNAFWVFQIGSTLTTASSSSVQFINLGSNNGSDDGVFWQVGSSATLGTGTAFEGNILALDSITMNTDATILNGRALARNAAVTMDTNTILNVCPIGGPGNGGPGLNGGLVYDQNGNIVPLGPQGSSAVPEPSTMLLFGLGGVGTACIRRRRKV